jgi:hypothetical protein
MTGSSWPKGRVFFGEDATIAEVFPIRERVRFLLRLELFNAFNRHFFGNPTMDRNVSYFATCGWHRETEPASLPPAWEVRTIEVRPRGGAHR